MTSQPSQKRHLPWTYWPIFIAGLLAIMVISGVLAALLSLNPYVAMFVAGGAWGVRETYILKRRGF